MSTTPSSSPTPSAGAANDAPRHISLELEDAVATLGTLQLQIDQARAVLAGVEHASAEAERRAGSMQAAQLREANEQLVLAMVQAKDDAESRHRAFEAVSRSAELDGLTELPNRALLLDRFRHAIATAKRRGARLALMFLDLDHFKQINDSLGHAVGDEVLKQVALRLAGAVRAADTVGRHGGDEFVILLGEVSLPRDPALIAEKVLAAISAPCQIGDLTLRLTASIGVSIYPDDGEDPDTLMACADTAMYRAKRLGAGGFVLHADETLREFGPPRSRQPVPHASPTPQERSLADHARRHAHLREANAQLVLAALGAQDLQAASETAHRQQTESLAIVAHELRNPLMPIRTAASLLHQVGPQELPRVQAIIERQVAHMARMVDDLLDVSRVNTGKLRVEWRRVDMAATIEAAIDTCRPAMDARQQRLSIQLPAASAMRIDGDAIRLSQVVTNLLDNASKYTPNGGAISLSVEVSEQTLVLCVSDTGIGITREALPKVFEPFVQEAHAIGFNGVGLGIGLTVVGELVKAHGGHVVASSDGAGCGSRFVVTLPQAGGSLDAAA